MRHGSTHLTSIAPRFLLTDMIDFPWYSVRDYFLVRSYLFAEPIGLKTSEVDNGAYLLSSLSSIAGSDLVEWSV